MGKRDGRRKLTDKQIKKIISDYAMTNNLSETGRINNVSATTVKRIITDDRNKEQLKIVEQKKEENTKDILEYIDETFEKQKKVMDLSLKVLTDKLEKPDMFTNIKDVVTVYGVLSDKALKVKELKVRQLELQQSRSNAETVNKNILNIASLIKNPVPVRTAEEVENE